MGLPPDSYSNPQCSCRHYSRRVSDIRSEEVHIFLRGDAVDRHRWLSRPSRYKELHWHKCPSDRSAQSHRNVCLRRLKKDCGLGHFVRLTVLAFASESAVCVDTLTAVETHVSQSTFIDVAFAESSLNIVFFTVISGQQTSKPSGHSH